jgi:outer membrane cobalamin receptor
MPNKILRYSLFSINLFLTCTLTGQVVSQKDTVKIGEVIIQRNKYIYQLPGYKTERIDSAILENYSQLTLADLLEENLNISVKSYGMGGAATAALRGTGAGHTQIAWNGIDLSNPMLGQFDLSLITPGLTDGIAVYYSGASMLINNGGIGGIINLLTCPDWDEGTNISVSSSAGSFGHYSGLMKIKMGTRRFQSGTKVFLQASENNFRYLDDYSFQEPLWQTRQHNQERNSALMQEFYLRGANSVTSARIWYQSTDRNLPASLLTQQTRSGEEQKDEAVRSMINYHFFSGETDFNLTGAWLRNRLNYSNRLASIESRNLSDAFTLKMSGYKDVSGSARLGFTLEENMNVINTNNYAGTARRNKASATAFLDYKITSLLTSVMLIREIMDKDRLIAPDFSTAVQMKLSSRKDYYIKASISRNSKLPGMNDLYWIPGGNPDLRNEYSFNYELSYSMHENLLPGVGINYGLTVYNNNIRDMIQWSPGQFSYWTADNIKNVNTYGLETSLSIKYKTGKLSTELKSGYSLTKAENAGPESGNSILSGSQLVYIPVNKANASLGFKYGKLYASWISNFTGKRFITTDNSRYLPGYFINNVYTGIKYDLKQISVLTEMGIENVFDVYYQAIAYYPLPGRFYTLKILLQINKKQ